MCPPQRAVSGTQKLLMKRQVRDTKERGVKVLLWLLQGLVKQNSSAITRWKGVCVTCKDDVMMALFKKCFDVAPGDRMGLFSRRVSLLGAEGPNFCRGFVELQYSKCYHILFLTQMKNKVQNFLGNHILKNNVKLNAESYCNNT